MPMTKIEQTRKILIEQHGEPKVEIKDGMKYRYVNVDLQNFDNMMECVFKLSSKFDITLLEEHIDVLCDFALTEIQPNVTNVVNKLKKLVAAKNINSGKKAFVGLLNRFENFRNEDDYDARYTINYFVEYLKCENVRYQNSFKSLM